MKNLSGNTRVWLLASLLLSLPSLAVPQNLEVRGQASVAIGVNDSAAFTFRSSLRYIPSLFLNVPVAETQTLDGELAANLFGSVNVPKKQRPATDLSLDLYRAWVRYAAPQLEVRAGLQKISFGSATLFRPLMWFDSIDPRDPLQITGGVYALLGRFFFMSTANIWLWGLYGRDELKGWETIPTKQGSVEFGGRLQMPVLTGEAAVTYHHRTTQLSFTPPGVPVPDQQTMTFPEDRAGFDGKWDVGPGIWIESAVVRQNTEAVPYRWQQALTLGTDYTLSVGQGLTAMAEYFLQSYTATLFGAGPTAQLAGLSVSYPLGILDNVSGIFFYDLRNSDPYVYLDWRRTYDNWLFNLILFANPDQPGFVAGLQQSLSLAGKGFVFLVVFNH